MKLFGRDFYLLLPLSLEATIQPIYLHTRIIFLLALFIGCEEADKQNDAVLPRQVLCSASIFLTRNTPSYGPWSFRGSK